MEHIGTIETTDGSLLEVDLVEYAIQVGSRADLRDGIENLISSLFDLDPTIVVIYWGDDEHWADEYADWRGGYA